MDNNICHVYYFSSDICLQSMADFVDQNARYWQKGFGYYTMMGGCTYHMKTGYVIKV